MICSSTSNPTLSCSRHRKRLSHVEFDQHVRPYSCERTRWTVEALHQCSGTLVKRTLLLVLWELAINGTKVKEAHGAMQVWYPGCTAVPSICSDQVNVGTGPYMYTLQNGINPNPIIYLMFHFDYTFLNQWTHLLYKYLRHLMFI